MPNVRGSETVEYECEFEIWCAHCGNGICANTKYTGGTMGNNTFTTYCDQCDKDHEKEIESLTVLVGRLEDEIAELKAELKGVPV